MDATNTKLTEAACEPIGPAAEGTGELNGPEETDGDSDFPPDFVAEHMHLLEHGQVEDPPVRLRTPGPGPTRAMITNFLRDRALRRAQDLGVGVPRHRRLAARRRAPRGRARRPPRPLASTSRAAPEPPASAGSERTSANVRTGEGEDARELQGEAALARDLPLHVGGDVGSALSARLLAGAARRLRDHGGGVVRSFTPAWWEVPREAWGSISVLASAERPEVIEAARAARYAVAIVADKFPTHHRAFVLPGSSAKVVPCPAETRGRTCVECRLCLDADELVTRSVAIAFEAHGPTARRVRNALADLMMQTGQAAPSEAHGDAPAPARGAA